VVFDDKTLEKYADVLLWGLKTARGASKGKYEKGDIISVAVENFLDPSSMKLAEFLMAKILMKGMHPIIDFLKPPTMELCFYKNIIDNIQLKFVSPGRKEFCKNLNGRIFIMAPGSLTHLKEVDSSKIAESIKSAKFIRDILSRREEKGLYGWTLCLLPTQELAKHSGLSIDKYAEQIIKACLLDDNDPIKKWEELKSSSEEIKKRLNSITVKTGKLRVESDNIDMLITPGKKRQWLGVSGHNIPSPEIFTSPDWRGTQGVYFADQPSYRSGNLVKGVRLSFKDGRVATVKAEEGEDFIKKQLAMDDGAGKIGEFSLTDIRFSRIDKFMANTLFDENFGGKHGNCHIAVGSAYTQAYSGNPADLTKKEKKNLGFNDSSLHWDLVNSEPKKVTAYLISGKKIVVYENGKFV